MARPDRTRASPADPTDSGYAWVLVAASFLVLFFVYGTVFTFTVYARAVQTAFGLSAVGASVAYSVALFCFFVAGGLVGVFATRIRLRRVMAGAAVAVVAGVGLLFAGRSLAGLVVAFALVGTAAGTSFVVIVSLLPRWFDQYEGRAMGVALTGNGLGVLVLPYVWLPLLDARGFRIAYAIVASGLVIALVVAAWLFRRPPSDGPDGSAGDGAAEASDGVTVDWLRGLVRDPRFAAAFLAVPAIWMWYHVLSGSLVDVLVWSGLGRTTAARAFGFVGGISILSRVGSGLVADAVGLRKTLVASTVVVAVGLGLLTAGPTVALLAVVTFGVGLGGVATLYTPALVGAYGPRNATAVVGIFQLSMGLSGLLAPAGTSALAEATGGYALPMTLLGAVTVLGAGLFWAGTRPTDG